MKARERERKKERQKGKKGFPLVYGLRTTLLSKSQYEGRGSLDKSIEQMNHKRMNEKVWEQPGTCLRTIFAPMM